MDSKTDKYMQDKLIYLNTHDSLTGLYNRVYISSELKKLDIFERYPFSIIIADINGMKVVNEVFGFEVSDAMLKQTAAALKTTAGAGSIVARWGGDEFAILLPETDEAAAEMICEHIFTECLKIEEKHIRPSIAFGSATKKGAFQNINQILSEAEDRMFRHKLLASQSIRSSIITSLSKALFQKSSETEEHAERVRKMAGIIGEKTGLSRDELDNLYLLSILHDIGKIAISDNILSKPGKLDEAEWKEMKKHSEIGFKIASASTALSNIAEDILSHHERWDGTGYPQGLKGKEIPKLSRIIAVVDSYDVITHGRAYKPALGKKLALEEIKRCSGTQFDPDIVTAFYDMFS